MQLTISKVSEDQVPVAHRGSGAVVDALTQQFVTLAGQSTLGEWYTTPVDDMLVVSTALRNAAALVGTGMGIREELQNPDKVTTNRKGETVVDRHQPGVIFFTFKQKRERKPGSKTPGRKSTK